MPTVRKRVTRKPVELNLPDWKIHFLKTGERPTSTDLNKFQVLNFTWGPEAALTWLKIKDSFPPGTFPFAEKKIEDWKGWRQVKIAMGLIKDEGKEKS